jgi:Secretion system C-terminal sorting domain
VAVGEGIVMTGTSSVGIIQTVSKKPFVKNGNISIGKNNIVVSLPMTSSEVTIELFNVAGKKIYSSSHQTHNGTLNIPLSGLSTGTYLMSITGRNTTLSSSFVLTR